MDKQVEIQILNALKEINTKLDSQDEMLKGHSQMLQEQGKMLQGHSQMLQEQGKMLKGHSQMLQEQGKMLKGHSQMLQEHSQMLKEHGQVLSALKTGQEFLKAELSEMKLQNAKEFGEIKQILVRHEDSIELLKEESWDHKNNIRRIQKTLGMC